MTEHQPPLFEAAASPNSVPEDIRRWMQKMTFGRKGPFLPSGLLVTQSATPAMNVLVADGTAMIPGTSNTFQGSYFVENRGSTTVTIPAAHSSLARWDLLVAQVRDAAYTGTNNDWLLNYISGAPAFSPVAPALPASSIALARIAVPAGATSITNANITDLRLSATYGQSLVMGELATSVTPTLGAGWTQAGGYSPLTARRDGGLVHLSGVVQNANAFTPSGNLVLSLPDGFRPAGLLFGVVPYSSSAGVGHWDVNPSGNVTVARSTGTIPAGDLHGINLFWPAA